LGKYLRFTLSQRADILGSWYIFPSSAEKGQYEHLKSQYAADEIEHADRIGSGLHEDPVHRAANYLTQEQLASGRIYSDTGGDGRSFRLQFNLINCRKYFS